MASCLLVGSDKPGLVVITEAVGRTIPTGGETRAVTGELMGSRGAWDGFATCKNKYALIGKLKRHEKRKNRAFYYRVADSVAMS